MLHCLLHYWCLILLCFVMLGQGYYLTTVSSQRAPQLENIMKSLEKNRQSRSMNKRNDRAFTHSFYHRMMRHKNYKDEQAFVEKMFRLFDINSDQVIERDEFRAIFKLLGIISHPQ